MGARCRCLAKARKVPTWVRALPSSNWDRPVSVRPTSTRPIGEELRACTLAGRHRQSHVQWAGPLPTRVCPHELRFRFRPFGHLPFPTSRPARSRKPNHIDNMRLRQRDTDGTSAPEGVLSLRVNGGSMASHKYEVGQDVRLRPNRMSSSGRVSGVQNHAPTAV